MYKLIVYKFIVKNKKKTRYNITTYNFIKKEDLSNKFLEVKKIYKDWSYYVEVKKMLGDEKI